MDHYHARRYRSLELHACEVLRRDRILVRWYKGDPSRRSPLPLLHPFLGRRPLARPSRFSLLATSGRSKPLHSRGRRWPLHLVLANTSVIVSNDPSFADLLILVFPVQQSWRTWLAPETLLSPIPTLSQRLDPKLTCSTIQGFPFHLRTGTHCRHWWRNGVPPA